VEGSKVGEAVCLPTCPCWIRIGGWVMILTVVLPSDCG